MSEKNELIAFIETQIEIEKQIVASLRESLVNIDNQAVKGVLKGISRDSEKHADMYRAVLRLLTDVPSALTQEHLDKQIALVEKHIAGRHPAALGGRHLTRCRIDPQAGNSGRHIVFEQVAVIAGNLNNKAFVGQASPFDGRLHQLLGMLQQRRRKRRIIPIPLREQDLARNGFQNLDQSAVRAKSHFQRIMGLGLVQALRGQ